MILHKILDLTLSDMHLKMISICLSPNKLSRSDANKINKSIDVVRMFQTVDK